MTRRLGPVLWLLSLTAVSCGRGPLTPGPGQLLLRYEPAVGSSTRYHVVIRDVPGDRPGRTVSAIRILSYGRDPEDRVTGVDAAHTRVFLAGEGGSLVELPELTIALRRDELGHLHGVELPDDRGEAAGELGRDLAEGVTFPELPVGVGDTWELPSIERALPDGSSVPVTRQARLVGVDDGVARVEVTGHPEDRVLELNGARVAVAGELEQRFDVRVADGLLIEGVGFTELRLRSMLSDGSELGVIAHRTRMRTRRVSGAAPEPVAHDWRPDRPDSTCMARLTAMERRFERAPRQVDLGGLAASEMSFPVRGDARDVDEVGPVIAGVDEETMLGALAGADVRRAMVLYVAAPADVPDDELGAWFGTVPSMVELRRLAIRQVNPPSPPSPPAIDALAAAMREEGGPGNGAWSRAFSPLIALCGEARDGLREAHALAASERPADLRAALVRAFGRCGCGATDLARLERTLDLRFGGPHLGWVSLR